jgi:Tol biopolymer transport system component
MRLAVPPSFGGTAISPDGRLLVFSARDNGAKGPVLWLRPIDSVAAHPLSGTEGRQFPFWSPDSQSLAFFVDDKLERMTITGGAPVTLCEVKVPGPAGGAWNRDGLILFAGDDGLYRVSASGGIAARITQVQAERYETGHGFPQFLPDGQRFLYYIQSSDPGVQGVYVASLDRPGERNRIWALTTELFIQGLAGTILDFYCGCGNRCFWLNLSTSTN